MPPRPRAPAFLVNTDSDTITSSKRSIPSPSSFRLSTLSRPTLADYVERARARTRGKSIRQAVPQCSVRLAHTGTHLALLDPDSRKPVLYTGIINLILLLAVAGHARLVIENFQRYGWLVDPAKYLTAAPDELAVFALALCAMGINYVVAYAIEKATAPTLLNPSQDPLLLHVANIFATFALSTYIAQHYTPSATFSGALILLGLTTGVKIWSYASTNRALRDAYLCGVLTPYDVHLLDGSPKAECEMYPQNVSVSALAYFIAAPTLCFQPSYPRSAQGVRPHRILSLLIQLVLSATVLLFIVDQYCLPTLVYSTRYFDSTGVMVDPIGALERTLKLGAAATIGFLCMFYHFFHCYLNLLAELTRFADRRFYDAWWNATTLADAWRMWNRPVHTFCVRHIHVPLRQIGLPSALAGLATFTVSAVAHEMICAVTSKHWLGWAFAGFVAQVPLIAFTEAVKRWEAGRDTNGMIGNWCVWLVFIVVGWPGLTIRYYHAWAVSNGTA